MYISYYSMVNDDSKLESQYNGSTAELPPQWIGVQFGSFASKPENVRRELPLCSVSHHVSVLIWLFIVQVSTG